MAPGPAGPNPRRQRGIAAGAGRAGAPRRPAPLTGAACVCICSRNPGGSSTHRERHGRGRVSRAGGWLGGGGRRGRISLGRALPRCSVSGFAASAGWCLRRAGPRRGAAARFLRARGGMRVLGPGRQGRWCTASPSYGSTERGQLDASPGGFSLLAPFKFMHFFSFSFDLVL